MRLAHSTNFIFLLMTVGCVQNTASKPTVPAPIQTDQKEAQTVDSATVQPTPDAAEGSKSDATNSAPTDSTASDASRIAESADPKSSAAPAEKDSPAENPAATRDDDRSLAKPVDLTEFYTFPVVEFADLPNPFFAVPQGKQQFDKVPVDIAGLIFLWGRNHASKGRVYREYVEGIPVDRKFESLYVYHFTRWKGADGTPVMNVVLNYGPDDHRAHELRYGEHVRDWYWEPGDPETISNPSSKRVWQAENPKKPNTLLLMFMTEIQNTRPNDKVTTIDLVSGLEEPVWSTMGLTTGPAGLLSKVSVEK